MMKIRMTKREVELNKANLAGQRSNYYEKCPQEYAYDPGLKLAWQAGRKYIRDLYENTFSA